MTAYYPPSRCPNQACAARSLDAITPQPRERWSVVRPMNLRRAALALGAIVLAASPTAVATAKPPKPGPGSTLSIAAKPSPVVFGRSTVVSGKLVGTNVSGQTVTLRSDPFPFGKLSNAGTIPTNATGDYAFTQKPTVNTRYQTRVGNVQSAIITVLVR